MDNRNRLPVNRNGGAGAAGEDDATLVAEAQADPQAFGVLYERYVRAIYNYVYYRTGHHDDAEDLTARVFQQAMNHLSRYRDRGLPFSAWLYRIAHNAVVNWHRDRSRRRSIPLRGPILEDLRAEPPESTADWRYERELLMAALRRLPQDRQQLIVLKFVEHLSNAEIGVIMKRSEGAIKSLYHRTLVALREDLNRLDGAGNRQTLLVDDKETNS